MKRLRLVSARDPVTPVPRPSRAALREDEVLRACSVVLQYCRGSSWEEPFDPTDPSTYNFWPNSASRDWWNGPGMNSGFRIVRARKCERP